MNHPVVGVSWYEAVAYSEWLSEQNELEIRLPTEAEWEKAARGEDGQKYPWGDEEPNPDLLNYRSNVGKTTEVGQYLTGKSPYNALDMAGNVWEWTSTIYDTDRFPYPYKKDERESLDGEDRRVLRGGSWFFTAGNVRAANRGRNVPNARFNYLGVRLVMSPGS